ELMAVSLERVRASSAAAKFRLESGPQHEPVRLSGHMRGIAERLQESRAQTARDEVVGRARRIARLQEKMIATLPRPQPARPDANGDAIDEIGFKQTEQA